MNKLSAEQINQVFSQVPGTLRKLAAERDFWKQEAETRMQHDEATKVASMMHEKGINADVPIKDLIEQLEKAASNGRLPQIAEAVEMVGPDMGTKIASLTNDENRAQGGSSAFESFILGGVG